MDQENLKQKLIDLKSIIHSMDSVLIAYSGGVDSTFLCKIAFEVLGEKALAVTASSETYTSTELNTSLELAKEIGIRHKIIETRELDIPNFRDNPPERCYYCKYELYVKLLDIAKEEHLNFVADGTNSDDLKDYRPGLKASDELNIRHPFLECKLTKEDIMILAKEMGIRTYNKPPSACLASRVPYGERITSEKLKQIGEGEKFLQNQGFRQVRLRHHGTIARIEVEPENIYSLIQIKDKVIEKLKSIGYTYVTLDLEGYTTGSMNKVLKL